MTGSSGARLSRRAVAGLAAAQLAWQVATLDINDAGNCLTRFKCNQLVGWLLFLGLVADMGADCAARRAVNRTQAARLAIEANRAVMQGPVNS